MEILYGTVLITSSMCVLQEYRKIEYFTFCFFLNVITGGGLHTGGGGGGGGGNEGGGGGGTFRVRVGIDVVDDDDDDVW